MTQKLEHRWVGGWLHFTLNQSPLERFDPAEDGDELSGAGSDVVRLMEAAKWHRAACLVRRKIHLNANDIETAMASALTF